MFTRAQFVRLFVLAVLGVAVIAGAENLLINAGFETMENTSGGPSGNYGDWNGDYSGIVGMTSGITPMSGNQMFQFKGTSHGGNGYGNSSEVFQVVNVSNYASLIASGKAVANASAYFNRVAGDSQTDKGFNIVLMAWSGSPSTFASRWETSTYSGSLAYTITPDIITDSLPGTWQQKTVTLNIPANTTFLVFDFFANEDIFNDYDSSEYDGHFADNAVVEIIPEPATLSLLAIGIFGLLKRRNS